MPKTSRCDMGCESDAQQSSQAKEKGENAVEKKRVGNNNHHSFEFSCKLGSMCLTLHINSIERRVNHINHISMMHD